MQDKNKGKVKNNWWNTLLIFLDNIARKLITDMFWAYKISSEEIGMASSDWQTATRSIWQVTRVQKCMKITMQAPAMEQARVESERKINMWLCCLPSMTFHLALVGCSSTAEFGGITVSIRKDKTSLPFEAALLGIKSRIKIQMEKREILEKWSKGQESKTKWKE